MFLSSSWLAGYFFLLKVQSGFLLLLNCLILILSWILWERVLVDNQLLFISILISKHIISGSIIYGLI